MMFHVQDSQPSRDQNAGIYILCIRFDKVTGGYINRQASFFYHLYLHTSNLNTKHTSSQSTLLTKLHDVSPYTAWK